MPTPQSIPKLYQMLLRCLAIGAVAGLLFARFGPSGAVAGVLAAPIVNLAVGVPLHVLDAWLRRKSRHPLWLAGAEGRAWLRTEEGRRWSADNAA